LGSTPAFDDRQKKQAACHILDCPNSSFFMDLRAFSLLRLLATSRDSRYFATALANRLWPPPSGAGATSVMR
jgi:hypothetical protein